MPAPQHQPSPSRSRFYRPATIRALNEKRTVGGEEFDLYEISCSSEFPVERRTWDGEVYHEVLEHSAEAVELDRFNSGTAAVTNEHYLGQVGVVDSSRVDGDHVLRAIVRFSKNPGGQELERDVRSEVRMNTSIGQDPIEWVIEAAKDGRPTTVRVTKWRPMEVAFVAVPADPTVGPNRSADDRESPVYFQNRSARMDPITGAAPAATPSPTPTPAVTRGMDMDEHKRALDAAVAASHTRAKEILEVATTFGMTERAAEWIASGKTVDQVKGDILETTRTRGAGQPNAEAIVNLSEKDAGRYSVLRAIRLANDLEEGRNVRGLEAEVHQEIAKVIPAGVRRGGILIPMRLRDFPGLQTRGLDTKTAGKGADLVFDDQPGDLIDMLRARTRCVEAGAIMLPNLQGNVPFPKEVAGMGVEWVAENPATDSGQSDPATGQVILSPKAMSGGTEYSRQLLAQSPYDVEGIVRRSLTLGHSAAFDRAGLHGSGVNGEPLGLYNAPDVQAIDPNGVPTFDHILDMVGLVADANVDDEASLSFMTTPLMARKMRGTLEFATAGAQTVWTGKITSGEMAGYPARATNQVRKDMGAGANEHGLVFGQWAQMVFGLWGVLEIMIDPLAKARRGQIVVISYQMGDVVFKQAQAFVKAKRARIA